IVKVQMPGILLTIWSRPVSGIDWTCSRLSTVVLTSSFSTSDPLPALTVTGGSVTGAGVTGWVFWALANAGPNARPANAARLATRMNNIEMLLDGQTNATHRQAHRGYDCQTRMGGPRGWLGPS